MKASDELRAQISGVTDAQLHKMVGPDATSYLSEVTRLASEELKGRGVDIPKDLGPGSWRRYAVVIFFLALFGSVLFVITNSELVLPVLVPILWFLIWPDRVKFARWSYLSSDGKIDLVRMFVVALTTTVAVVVLVLVGHLKWL